MTKEQVINTLNSLKQYYNDKNEDSYVGFDDEDNESIDMAIKALEQQPSLKDRLEKEYLVESLKEDLQKLYAENEELHKKLEQQPCEDCISRKETIEWLKKVTVTDGITFKTGFEQIIYDIEQMPSVTPKAEWIPCSDRLPDNLGTYLITLENGDVCKCEFNPDYTDEEHDKGAFTYQHDYFDNYTLGLIDSEEIAVDAIAWMPFEPYKAESEE